MLLPLLLALPAQGQNAYYDSKFIIDWLKHEPGDNREVERRYEAQVLNKLESYIPSSVLNSTSDSARYTIVDSILALILERNYVSISVGSIDTLLSSGNKLRTLLHDHPKDTSVFRQLNEMPERKKTMEGYLARNKASLDALNRLLAGNVAGVKVDFGSAIVIQTDSATMTVEEYTRISPDTLSLLGKTTFARAMLEELNGMEPDTANRKLYILRCLKRTLEEGNTWMETRIHYYDVIAQKLFKNLSKEAQMALVKTAKPGKGAREPEGLPAVSMEEARNEAILRIEAQQNQPTMQLANFKMPTQAEMVDALATYIANRFKQEAILYMIDQLKSNLAADTFTTVLFPETKRLLFRQSAFTTPHFGSEWRYAISKDYAYMADHLMGSVYITNRINSRSFSYMHDAWLLARMIEKKYSFVEIVRNYATIDVDSIKTAPIQKFLQWSNIINEQLFSVVNPQAFVEGDGKPVANLSAQSDYWIAPAKFMAEMTAEHLSLFLSMVGEKYKIDIKNDLGVNLGSALDVQRRRLPVVQKWFSKNLLILNRFQKGQGKMMEDHTASDLFNGATYWTFMNDIIRSMTDTGVLRSLRGEDIAALSNVADLNEIYSSFQAKNYSAAIGQLLAVTERVCQESNGDMVAQGLTTPDEDYLAQLEQKNGVQALRVYSSYFLPTTNVHDLDSLKKEFESRAKKLAAIAPGKKTQLDELTARYASYKWIDEDEYEDMTKYMEGLRAAMATEGTSALAAMDGLVRYYDTSIHELIAKKRTRLAGHNSCFCSSLSRAKGFAALLNDVMFAGNNPQALSRVLESYAAPPISYKVKRFTRATWDVGAYLGMYAGGELLPQQRNAGDSIRFVYGLTVPLGINYTWATTKKATDGQVKNPYSHRRKGVREYRGVSHTLSLSVIDIAAPVAFRLTNTYDGALPRDVKWSQLLSPGFHYRYGFRNSPFCFSTGVQYTPQLRKMDAHTQLNAVRAYLGVVFDMPMFFISK